MFIIHYLGGYFFFRTQYIRTVTCRCHSYLECTRQSSIHIDIVASGVYMIAVAAARRKTRYTDTSSNTSSNSLSSAVKIKTFNSKSFQLWLSSTLVEEKPLCFTAVLSSSSSFLFFCYLNGFHSYFHTISGLGVI